MKKKSIISKNEIDLIELIEIFWNEKIKIISIIIITFVISFGYDLLTPTKENSYKISATIKASNKINFIKFVPIYKYLSSEYFTLQVNEPESDKKFNPQSTDINFNNISNIGLLETFANEVLDYEELVLTLENNKTITKNLSELTKAQKKQKLYEYSKFLEVEQIEQKGVLDHFKVSFTSNNINTGKEILDQTIKLTISNLERSIYDELLVGLDQIKVKKLFTDLRMIEFLSEQSSIAEALSLEGNYIQTNNDQLSFNVNMRDDFYYLKGKKVIDKEIDIIKNRKYVEISSIKKKINLLKESDIKWVDYNSNLLDVRDLTYTHIKMSSLSIVFGPLIGLIYVLISNRFRSKKFAKK
jgi:LPS O-antigen subunit length determinant protein (WzzB/FepE family)